MFSEPIRFPDARISAFSGKPKNGLQPGHLDIDAMLNRQVAEALGCYELVFVREGVPNDGFRSIKLDTSCSSFDGRLTISGLKQELQLAGDKASAFKAEKWEDGQLRIRFRLAVSQRWEEIHAFIGGVGDASGDLLVRPLQIGLDGESNAAAEVRAEASGGTINPVLEFGQPAAADKKRGAGAVASKRQVEIAENGGVPPAKPRGRGRPKGAKNKSKRNMPAPTPSAVNATVQ